MTKILNGVSSFITAMTKADAMAPIVALEATVTGGRTIQAYKRGGGDEARERFIEEATGAVVWLGGVKVLNDIGDKILKQKFGTNFDVGTDKVLRTPFDNFMRKNPPKKITPNQVALMKAGKVLASVVLADAFIGLVVPKINQALTRALITNKRQKENGNVQAKAEASNNKAGKNPAFKGSGALSAINVFTNAIENTNTGKLLSTDAGLVSGRMYSARNGTERREIAIRDIGSIYFYMWAQGHVGNLLNLITTGKSERLDPNTTLLLDKHLNKFLDSKGGELSVEEFRKAVLGEKVELPKDKNFVFEIGELSAFDKFMNKFRSVKAEPLQVAKVSDLQKLNLGDDLMNRIVEMAKLQPERMSEAVITKQQILDAINKSEINDPKFLDEVFSKFTEGASKNEYKFVSNKKLYNLKGLMEDYVESACKKAKDGKVTKATLSAAKNGNFVANTANFAAGFAVAGMFLSTLIPKFQYWYTKHTTGKHSFPGVYEFEQQEDVKIAEA